MPGEPELYTCAVCHNVYETTLTEEEAWAEAAEEFPGGEEVWGPFQKVCHDCYQRVFGSAQN